MSYRRGLLVLAVVLAACSGDDAAAPPSTTTTPAVAGTGAPGVGDRYFPGLGNGGYDVGHYDLALTVDPATGGLSGVATIDAVATQDLAAFDLDLLGLDVASVTVDGVAATTARDGRELTVTPARTVAGGAGFTTAVTYAGVPQPIDSGVEVVPDVGWFVRPGGAGTYVLAEPSGAATWYPVNDHPSDKATYTFRITVPSGVEAVANGALTSHTNDADTGDVWTWTMDRPMASYLATVVTGQLSIVESTSPAGVPIRNAFPDDLPAEVRAGFDRQGEMLDFFAGQFGPYPFAAYGAVVVDEPLGVALETQSLSLFGYGGEPPPAAIVAHELAHQWFGDAVSLGAWEDVWLNEGFATYAQWLWSAHDGGAPVDQVAAAAHERLDRTGAGDVPPGDPGVAGLFAPTVYDRGALTLHALRRTVGDDAFFTILREWVSGFSGRSASTDDFVALASSVSGRDLAGFFAQWVDAAALPDLPGT